MRSFIPDFSSNPTLHEAIDITTNKTSFVVFAIILYFKMLYVMIVICFTLYRMHTLNLYQ